MGKDAAWVAASFFFLVFRFHFSFMFSGFIFATSPFRTFIKYTSNDNRDGSYPYPDERSGFTSVSRPFLCDFHGRFDALINSIFSYLFEPFQKRTSSNLGYCLSHYRGRLISQFFELVFYIAHFFTSLCDPSISILYHIFIENGSFRENYVCFYGTQEII